MNTKTFLDLEFWRVVRKEFARYDGDYLCNGSKMFCFVWRNSVSRSDLTSLAQEYLVDSQQTKDISVSKAGHSISPLFNNAGVVSDRVLRLSFIDWNIKRLSEK